MRTSFFYAQSPDFHKLGLLEKSEYAVTVSKLKETPNIM